MGILSLIKKYQVQLTLLIICIISLSLFYPSLNYYFFQDDWFVLNWVRSNDFLSFFKFRTDIIYWRPLSMPLYFFLNYRLFGLNNLAFHATAFLLFFALLLSIFFLFKLLTKDKKISLFATFLYGTWSIHFMSLSWLSTTSYIIGSLFLCVSFILFLKYSANKQSSYLILSFFIYLLALASTELSVVYSIFLLSWILIKKKENYRVLLPFFASILIYIFFRFYIFPIPAKGEYEIAFNKQIINNLIWYIGWAFGLSERFKDLIIPKSPTQSFGFIIRYWSITIPALALFILSVYLGVRSSANKVYISNFLFGSLWFLLFLLPVLSLNNHSYSVYLSFAGLGLLHIMATFLNNVSNYWLLIIGVLWIMTNYGTARFNRYTHWTVNEQAVSKAYIHYTKNVVKNPQPDSFFLFRPSDGNFAQSNNFVLVEDENIIKQSLNDSSAVQVVYRDTTLKSLFARSLEPFEKPHGSTVYEIIPRVVRLE